MASEKVIEALEWALTEGRWRKEDLIGVLRGAARYANGQPVPCCTRCGRPEWEDGLIAKETIDDGGCDGTPIVSGFVCPPCLARPEGDEADGE